MPDSMATWSPEGVFWLVCGLMLAVLVFRFWWVVLGLGGSDGE